MVSQSKETVSKDANIKELEAKLEALRQHSELQQDLVMNLLQQSSKDDPMIISKDPKDLEVMANEGFEDKNGIAVDIVPFMVSVLAYKYRFVNTFNSTTIKIEVANPDYLLLYVFIWTEQVWISGVHERRYPENHVRFFWNFPTVLIKLIESR